MTERSTYGINTAILYLKLTLCNDWTCYFLSYLKYRYVNRKKNRNTSYEILKPFEKEKTIIAMFVPFGVLKKFQVKLMECWHQLYMESLMLFISYDSDVKLIGNFIDL